MNWTWDNGEIAPYVLVLHLGWFERTLAEIKELPEAILDSRAER
jgi:hypothetical protein